MNLPDYSCREIHTDFFMIPFLDSSLGCAPLELANGNGFYLLCLAVDLVIILECSLFLGWLAMALVR